MSRYIRPPVGMDVRGPSRGSLKIEDNLLIFVLDIDQLDRVAGSLGAPSYDHRNNFACEVDLVDSDRVVLRDVVLGRERPATRHWAHIVGKISSGEYRNHTGCGLRLGHINRGDLRVRNRASHHAEEQHAGHGEIVGESSPTGNQPLILFAEPWLANLEGGLGRFLGDGHWRLPAACRTALTMF